jgi:hypothetical protein
MKGLNMTKKAKGESLQAIVESILEKDGNQTRSELMPKVAKLKADAKEGSVGQALNIWRKKKGMVKSRAQKAPRIAAARTTKAVAGNGSPNSTADVLRKIAALAEIIDIPASLLPDVVRVLS